MTSIIAFLVGFIAIEHLYFLYLEMFQWTSPKGMKAFGIKSKDFAEQTKVLAANQGLYNGFLSAGLIYALLNTDYNTLGFFLVCIITAGIYAGYSMKQIKLFYIQSVPSIICLILIILKFYNF
ncbi:DUF1304 domain-containing protein [Bizionia sp. KMM 8389]